MTRILPALALLLVGGVVVAGAQTWTQPLPQPMPPPPAAAPPAQPVAPPPTPSATPTGAPNVDPSIVTSSAEVETIRRIAAARELIQMGLKDRDPLPLIVAARIFRGLQPFTGAAPLKKLGQSGEFFVEPMSEVFYNSATGLLKRAREYAQGRAEIVALINGIVVGRIKGAGGIVTVDSVAKRSTVTYEIVFEGRKRGAIYVESQDVNGRLGMAIRDGGDNAICEDRREGPLAYCEWTPRETGPFRVRITNGQDHDQDYVLVTN